MTVTPPLLKPAGGKDSPVGREAKKKKEDKSPDLNPTVLY